MREAGFKALPVVRRPDPYRGPEVESLSQFLKGLGEPPDGDAARCYQCSADSADDHGKQPDTRFVNYISNLISREKAAVTCCLASDYGFQEIEDDAWQRRWHSISVRAGASTLKLIRGALLDFDRARATQLGSMSGEALAAFWTSWQVKRHLADFCHRAILARGGDVHIDGRPFVDALRWADEVLATYAHEVRLTAPVTGPVVEPAEPERTAAIPDPAVETPTPTASHPEAGPQPRVRRGRPRQTPNRHPEVELFLNKVGKEAGREITIIDFCAVSGFGDDTVFGYWRRGNTERCSYVHAKQFEKTLKLSPEQFLDILTQSTPKRR
jgi:hypothetical protein